MSCDEIREYVLNLIPSLKHKLVFFKSLHRFEAFESIVLKYNVLVKIRIVGIVEILFYPVYRGERHHSQAFEQILTGPVVHNRGE